MSTIARVRLLLCIPFMLSLACGSAQTSTPVAPTTSGPRVIDQEWHYADYTGDLLSSCADFAIRYTIPAGSAWQPPARPDLPPAEGHRTLSLEVPCMTRFPRDASAGYCRTTQEAALTRFDAPSGTTLRLSAIEIHYGSVDDEDAARCARDGGQWALGAPSANGSTP